MLIALLVFWAGKYSWLEFGIGKPELIKSLWRAAWYAVLIFIFIDLLLLPFLEHFFGVVDISALDGIRGNPMNYMIFILFMWVVAAFGEEFLYRGFFMKRLAHILGNTDRSWLLSAIAISLLFGMAHLYQGISGVISTGMVGFCLAFIFYKNRNNLVLAMLTHGFYDMIGITLIYMSKETFFSNWISTFM
jgi:membrane protease YdiL (CAAX protease family)